jgi:CRISPR-associated protein Cmr4
MEARLFFLHALSPLHAGTGQGVGVIDLPVAREKSTGLPFLPGSSIKGVLRDSCTDPSLQKRVFGPQNTEAHLHAGSAQFSDARLLLLPIRSLAGTFAWITSPYILRRLLRDAKDARASGEPATVPEPATIEDCLVAANACDIAVPDGEQQKVYLEDLDLNATPNNQVDTWAAWIGPRVFPGDQDWQSMLAARLCIVHDDMLSFLLETATEISARIKLKEDSKTVEKGGLWYEEALPTETILLGLVLAQQVKATPKEVFDLLDGMVGKPMQFGGKATVGRGLCRMQMGSANPKEN